MQMALSIMPFPPMISTQAPHPFSAAIAFNPLYSNVGETINAGLLPGVQGRACTSCNDLHLSHQGRIDHPGNCPGNFLFVCQSHCLAFKPANEWEEILGTLINADCHGFPPFREDPHPMVFLCTIAAG